MTAHILYGYRIEDGKAVVDETPGRTGQNLLQRITYFRQSTEGGRRNGRLEDVLRQCRTNAPKYPLPWG